MQRLHFGLIIFSGRMATERCIGRLLHGAVKLLGGLANPEPLHDLAVVGHLCIARSRGNTRALLPLPTIKHARAIGRKYRPAVPTTTINAISARPNATHNTVRDRVSGRASVDGTDTKTAGICRRMSWGIASIPYSRVAPM